MDTAAVPGKRRGTGLCAAASLPCADSGTGAPRGGATGGPDAPWRLRAARTMGRLPGVQGRRDVSRVAQEMARLPGGTPMSGD